jgi:hypothetical protein
MARRSNHGSNIRQISTASGPRRSRKRAPKPDRPREKSKESAVAAEQPSPSKSPRLPSEGTVAALAYARASVADLGFFHFLIQTVTRSDYVAYVARQALDGKERDVTSPNDLLEIAPGVQTKILRENRQAFLEMFFSRLVDNFQKYLVDVIREILRSKPTMLRTRQQSITLDELLGYERIQDLVHDVIERKVNSLSYEGFAALQEWCTERGIQIEVPASQHETVIEVIATRNIIAHNRGFIDERYTRAVDVPKSRIGTHRLLSVDYFFGAYSLLSDAVFKTDTAARSKFGLPTVKIECLALNCWKRE